MKRSLLLAGAGLANTLIALRVHQRDPATRITMVESASAPLGNHTWSFHHGDLTAKQHAFMQPMVVHRWPAQQVRFPTYRRAWPAAYLSTTSESVAAELARHPGIKTICDCKVSKIEPNALHTADGSRQVGTACIDGRGPRHAEGLVLGFQKFLGREVRTAAPHGLEAPVIMDATVDQADGYRFVYVLPFDSHRLLIEDTYYSDAGELARPELIERIDRYAAEHGWTLAETLREEQGVLPILLGGEFDRFWPETGSVARSGLNAALFHPTTGYSLPQALALADRIADAWPLDGAALARLTRAHALNFWQRTGFYRLLNRMLFRAGQPELRYRVMARFFRLNTHLITNFYAASLTLPQRLRVITGKPPVPFFKALALVDEQAFLEREWNC